MKNIFAQISLPVDPRRRLASLMLLVFGMLMVHNVIPHHHIECSPASSENCTLDEERKRTDLSFWGLSGLLDFSHPDHLDKEVEFFEGASETRVKVDQRAIMDPSFASAAPLYHKNVAALTSTLWSFESPPISERRGVQANDPLRGPPVSIGLS